MALDGKKAAEAKARQEAVRVRREKKEQERLSKAVTTTANHTGKLQRTPPGHGQKEKVNRQTCVLCNRKMFLTQVCFQCISVKAVMITK